MTARTGRIASGATVARKLRRTFNPFAQQLAERVLAKALTGDATALSAAMGALLAANGNVLPSTSTSTKKE